VKPTPSVKLYWLAGIILAALTFCSRTAVGGSAFIVSLAVASVAYLLAVWELFRTPKIPRRVLFICLALAALLRIPFLITAVGPSDDIARYIWDGRLQKYGYNPYRVIPADRAFARLHTPYTRGLNNPDVPTPYPAGAEIFFRAVTAIHESPFAFKMAFVLCDVGIVLVLFDLLRRSGQESHWVLVYAWHPLVPLNVAGSGHIDILGVLLLLVSAAALRRQRRSIAAIAFGLAVAVKFLPIVLLPLYWRRLRVRDGLLALVAFALPYGPFLKGGRIPIGSLGTFVERFRFNDPLFSLLERTASLQFAAGLAVLAGLVVAAWLRRRPPRCWTDAWAWPMAASLVCAPVIYPWYLLWLLPFLRSVATLPLIVWSISILSTYLVWHLRSFGHAWQVPGWILLLEYGSVAATAAIVLLLRMGRPGTSAAGAK
jgi:Glycosyltransferase family 87